MQLVFRDWVRLTLPLHSTLVLSARHALGRAPLLTETFAAWKRFAQASVRVVLVTSFLATAKLVHVVDTRSAGYRCHKSRIRSAISQDMSLQSMGLKVMSAEVVQSTMLLSG